MPSCLHRLRLHQSAGYAIVIGVEVEVIHLSTELNDNLQIIANSLHSNYHFSLLAVSHMRCTLGAA